MKTNKEIIDSLTERQKQVARLIVQGKSNQEIADALNFRLKTAKWHSTVVYKKTNTEHRRHFISRFYNTLNEENQTEEMKEKNKALFNKLTKVQKKTCLLVAMGHTTKQVANIRNVGWQHTKDIMTKIYKTLQVKNGKEMVARYYDIIMGETYEFN